MTKKHRGGPGPVPPGNRSITGSTNLDKKGPITESEKGPGVGFEEQDVKRRLGDYGGAGEHPIQQPGRLNDGSNRGQRNRRKK